MGLLGDSFDDPKTMATLQLASGLLGSGNFGANLGQGLAGYQNTLYNAANQKQAQEMHALQIDAYKRHQAMEQLAMQRAQAKKDALPTLWTGGQSALPALAGDPTTGILPSAGRAAIEPTLDVQRGLSAGYTPDELMKLDSLRNVGQNEVTRTIKGMQNGREVEQQFDKFGRPVGQSFDQYRAPIEVATGDKKQFVDPYTLKPQATFAMGQSPDSRASNAVAWANNAVSRDRLAFDKQGGAEGVKPKLVGDQWVTAPNDMQPGQTRPAMPTTGQKDATEALALIQTARGIIPKSTGSYLGTGVDQAARVFGASTGGDTAAAQLKALEGALVSKMPKMSGPQSDKDVLLYKQMAGEIGDPTIPQSRKIAALDVIEEIQKRHAGQPAPAAKSNIFDTMPQPYTMKGQRIRDTTTGKIMVSDGMRWKDE